jgi:hypothetical protein
MRQVQMPYCLADMTGLVSVKLPGFALAYGAESAVAGTDVAAQHEGGRTVGPALKDVGALRFLTNRVQVQALDQLEQVVLVRRITQTNAEPLGLWLTWFLVENVKFAGQSISPLLEKVF